jgi:hypothetical protein
MEDYEEMEMPTPCSACGEIFDLNDGRGSEKWYPDTIICRECSDREQSEIEEDERWEGINNEISDAMYELKYEEDVSKLSEENKKALKSIVNKLN